MEATAGERKHIAVIGAGIVGVCAALSLRHEGFAVTLVDRQGPGEGTSFGNAAVISPDIVVPAATPGIVRRVPGMLLDPLGPLRIRWSYLPRVAPYLLRFLAASRKPRVEAISVAMAALARGAVDAYSPLTKMADAEDMIQRTGRLCVYESEEEFQAVQSNLELERRRGLRFEVLDSAELRQLEPSLAPIFPRGVFYPDSAHSVNNFRFVQVLADALQRHGGRSLRAEVRGFEVAANGDVAAIETDAGREPCDAVVVAVGAWSRPLARQLGADPPLETERGYHLTIGDPGVTPRIPFASNLCGFACTPLEHGLRVAGTVELAGFDAPPDWRRADVLMTHIRRLLPGVQDREVSRWMGHRPGLPDTVPVISPSPSHRNAFFAFGHGQVGLCLGARTGQLVTALVAGRDAGIDMAPYRIDRFQARRPRHG